VDALTCPSWCRAAGGKAATSARQPAASALRKPTALGRPLAKPLPAEGAARGTSGQAGPPSRATAGTRAAAAPQSALQRIHQRVSDAAARARSNLAYPLLTLDIPAARGFSY